MERKKTNDSERKSYLIGQKSFLEIILDQIKNCQCHFLSEKMSLKKLKHYLTIMKNNFVFISREKINSKLFLEKIIKTKKLTIQKGLNEKEVKEPMENVQNTQYNSIGSINYTRQSSKNINKMNDKINYSNEKEQLENLNFKIENEIEKIEFEIHKKINLIINLKTYKLNQEENLELICENQNIKEKALHIMKKNLKKYQKELLNIINIKIKNDLEINKTKEQIEYFKDQIKFAKNYIDSENIIYEDSSDFSKSIIIEETKQHILDDNKNNDKNIKKDNKNNKNKENRHSLDITYNFDENSNINNINSNQINLNDINNEINQKVIRSLSNKIKRMDFLNLNKNCNLNINFNFNNLNIINGNFKEDKNFQKENFNTINNFNEEENTEANILEKEKINDSSGSDYK